MTTLSDLQTQVRYLTNQENSEFVTNTELAYYLNSSLAELDDLLVSQQEDYRLVQELVTISSGNLIPLPDDFYQMRQIDFYTFTSQQQPWITIKRFMLKEQTRFSNTFVANNYGIPNLHYMLQDGYVAIVPETSAIGQYRLWYTPMYVQLVNQTDSIPSYFENQAWREYAVIDVCIKVLNKQNLDPSIFIEQKALLKTRIDAMAGHRDAGSPKHVVDNRYGDTSGYWGWGAGYGSGFSGF